MAVASDRPPVNSEIARTRREQIVSAAVEIIVTQGLHHLSLSRIETRAGMKRGQLTYYFPTKEDILLAVFDRLLMLICQQLDDNPSDRRGVPGIWECVQSLLHKTLQGNARYGAEFHALEYTFLAQIAHRNDFREKLAAVFSEWRDTMAAHWQVTARPASPLAMRVSARTVSSLVQAILHGLNVQLSADPNAFDRAEMLELCLGVLAPLFTTQADGSAKEPLS